MTHKQPTSKQAPASPNEIASWLDALEEGIVVVDADRKAQFVNDQAIALLALQRADIAPGLPVRELVEQAIAQASLLRPDGVSAEQYRDLMLTGIEQTTHNMQVRRDGMPALRLSVRHLPGNGRLISIVEQVIDVLEPIATRDGKATGSRLPVVVARQGFEVAPQLAEALEYLEEGFALYDSDCRFILCNRKFCELLFVDPDARPMPGEMMDDIVLRAGQMNAGNGRPEGMSVEEYAALSTAAFKQVQKKMRFPLDDGKVMEVSGYRTTNGGYLYTLLDITEREAAAAEVEQQRALAHQNEKLSALGELLAGVAHELNNPLSIVTGYAQMLEANENDEKSARRIEKIRNAAERSARIVKTFLAMARQRPAQIEHADPAELIETAAEIAAYGLRSAGGSVTIDYPASLPHVAVDKDQLVQVISNLIVNAEQAMKGMGDKARLRLEARERGTFVEISVTDNGEGMDAETQARIFEPFFTTKDVGEGTGFGLAFCHKIVTSHDGRLTVHSAAGEGSRFVISLPAITGPAASEDDVQIDAARTALDILVVDDERDVAELVAELLGAEGHRIKAVFAPIDAIRAATAQRFDIVISDMKMPGMMGDRLLERLVEVQPTLGGRVGFITGDSLSRRVADFLEAERHPFIEKPIGPDELRDLVQRLAPECGDPT